MVLACAPERWGNGLCGAQIILSKAPFRQQSPVPAITRSTFTTSWRSNLWKAISTCDDRSDDVTRVIAVAAHPRAYERRHRMDVRRPTCERSVSDGMTRKLAFGPVGASSSRSLDRDATLGFEAGEIVGDEEIGVRRRRSFAGRSSVHSTPRDSECESLTHCGRLRPRGRTSDCIDNRHSGIRDESRAIHILSALGFRLDRMFAPE